MERKELDITTHDTINITKMTQEEIEDVINAVLSGQKTFAEVATKNPGPKITITEVEGTNESR
tara:strand:- start:229 stop:417 length:189 start_codon:yes stop_codon:yes gene_type:complete